jgi:DNA invertase Pin-like site-specific DNA recombinase
MDNKKTRVAVYIRVADRNESRLAALEMQCRHYSEEVSRHHDWVLAEIYSDSGTNGSTKVKHPELDRLLDDCRTGKIDLIYTKSVSRVSQNAVQMLAICKELASLNPPVAVYFETENINSLDSVGGFPILEIVAAMAAEESRTKHETMPLGQAIRRNHKKHNKEKNRYV